MFQATQEGSVVFERLHATQEDSVVTISRFLLPLDISTASRSSSGTISPFSSFIFIFHRTPALKSSERLFFPSLRHSKSFPKGFPFLVSVLPKVSRLCLLKSRDSCCLSILYGLAVFVRLHISTFISRPPESLPRGFSLRFSVLQKVPRLRHLKSRDSHLAQK